MITFLLKKNQHYQLRRQRVALSTEAFLQIKPGVLGINPDAPVERYKDRLKKVKINNKKYWAVKGTKIYSVRRYLELMYYLIMEGDEYGLIKFKRGQSPDIIITKSRDKIKKILSPDDLIFRERLLISIPMNNLLLSPVAGFWPAKDKNVNRDDLKNLQQVIYNPMLVMDNSNFKNQHYPDIGAALLPSLWQYIVGDTLLDFNITPLEERIDAGAGEVRKVCAKPFNLYEDEINE